MQSFSLVRLQIKILLWHILRRLLEVLAQSQTSVRVQLLIAIVARWVYRAEQRVSFWFVIFIYLCAFAVQNIMFLIFTSDLFAPRKECYMHC